MRPLEIPARLQRGTTLQELSWRLQRSVHHPRRPLTSARTGRRAVRRASTP